jgi:hypothetical protein
MAQLQAAEVRTDAEPGQEDFGWYFTFRPGHTAHQLVLAYRPGDKDEPGTWIGWVERDAGLVGSLFGARNRGIELAAVKAIHEALSGSDKISTVRWHQKSDFDAGNEGAGRPQPDAAQPAHEAAGAATLGQNLSCLWPPHPAACASR